MQHVPSPRSVAHDSDAAGDDHVQPACVGARREKRFSVVVDAPHGTRRELSARNVRDAGEEREASDLCGVDHSVTLVPARGVRVDQDTRGTGVSRRRSTNNPLHKRPMTRTQIVLALIILASPSSACRTQTPDRPAHERAGDTRADSAFSALQQRGAQVMGVDQHTSSHQFEVLPDGGRIALERDVDDTAGVRTIRAHLRGIARAFATGDFSPSASVHAQTVPGTALMRARRGSIRYDFRELPRGGEVRITTTDPAALRAVHEFLGFQRGEHRVGGNSLSA